MSLVAASSPALGNLGDLVAASGSNSDRDSYPAVPIPKAVPATVPAAVALHRNAFPVTTAPALLSLRSSIRCMTCILRIIILGCVLALISTTAAAQISLTSAVSIALQRSPRVHVAQDDAAKALAVLQGTHDVYIPSLVGGAGLGEAYGYSPNPPTLFTFNAQSLVFNYAQFAYIRSARLGLAAANLAVDDAREAVAEDTVLTFIGLNHDQQRQRVLRDQLKYAGGLVDIVQDRFAAGLDTEVDLTSAKLSLAQLRLALLRSQDDVANGQDHMGRLLGLPPESVSVEAGFPVPPPLDVTHAPTRDDLPPGIASAFANASARQQSAIGDNRFLYRPQISLVVQYNRYASFTSSFQQLESLYGRIGANEQIYAVQISIPFFDKFRQARARETVADAAHALHDAENNRSQTLDGQHRLRHSVAELQARAEIASLEQQLSEQQLKILLIQVNASKGGPPVSPKEEQNSRINERQKYLALIDARRQLLDTEVNLLRQSGSLLSWLRSVQLQPQLPGNPSVSGAPVLPLEPATATPSSTRP